MHRPLARFSAGLATTLALSLAASDASAQAGAGGSAGWGSSLGWQSGVSGSPYPSAVLEVSGVIGGVLCGLTTTTNVLIAVRWARSDSVPGWAYAAGALAAFGGATHFVAAGLSAANRASLALNLSFGGYLTASAVFSFYAAVAGARPRQVADRTPVVAVSPWVLPGIHGVQWSGRF